MQHSLGILIIGFHHVVHIVLHSIGAGPLMEDHIHIRAVKIIIQDSLQKGILVHVIHKLQATEISVALILLLAVIQVIHNKNISTSLTIQFLDNIAADKTGSPCNNNHKSRSSQFFTSYITKLYHYNPITTVTSIHLYQYICIIPHLSAPSAAPDC